MSLGLFQMKREAVLEGWIRGGLLHFREGLGQLRFGAVKIAQLTNKHVFEGGGFFGGHIRGLSF